MSRPYIIYHMTTSIDGKITGKFLKSPESESVINAYYEKHRAFKADGFLCGRVTMQESFTGRESPNLSKYEGQVFDRCDYMANKTSTFYAVAVDTKGKLNWQSGIISDEDPGYNNAHIVEILTENVSDAFLGFLRDKGVSYIFAGKETLDLTMAMKKLNSLFGIKTLLLEGGGIVGASFAKENLIDEISLVVSPVCEGKGAQDLFAGEISENNFELSSCEKLENNGLWLRYKR